MSTPKSGWIARDADGELHWYDRKPEWSENLREWLPEPEGDVSDYPDLKPGECIQIGDDADALGAYIDSDEQIRLGSVQSELERTTERLAAAMSLIEAV